MCRLNRPALLEEYLLRLGKGDISTSVNIIYTHCPKNILNLCIVTVGSDRCVQRPDKYLVRIGFFLCWDSHYFWDSVDNSRLLGFSLFSSFTDFSFFCYLQLIMCKILKIIEPIKMFSTLIIYCREGMLYLSIPDV